MSSLGIFAGMVSRENWEDQLPYLTGSRAGAVNGNRMAESNYPTFPTVYPRDSKGRAQ
jgi:hypothetical protein